MFKHTYQTMNEKLEPENELIAATLDRMAARRSATLRREKTVGARHGKTPGRRPIRAGRVFTVALAAVLVLALSLTAVATAVPSFRDMLFGGGETESGPAGSGTPSAQTGLGAALTEIQNVSAEHDGFRLEILGATHDDEAMAIYYSLTDTSGQNRLDRDTKVIPATDLFERLQSNPGSGGDMVSSAYTADLLDYNPETGTVLCRYVLDTQNGTDLDLSKIDFSIFLIILGNQEIVLQPVSLNESDFTSDTLEMNGEKILKPGETPLSMEGLGQSAVTAMGFVDGALHIQTRVNTEDAEYFDADVQPIDKVISPEEVARAGGYTLEFERRESEAYYDRTGTVKEEGGEMVVHVVGGGQYFFNLEDGVPVRVTNEDFSNPHYTYREDVFKISPEELSYYNFYYSQMSYEKELRYGSWEFEDTAGRSSSEGMGAYHSGLQISFEVSDAAKSPSKTLTELSVDGGMIDTLTLGGLGVTVDADRELAEKAEITAQCGGETVHYSKTIVTGVPVQNSITTVDSYTGPVTVKYLADRPIDPETITSLTVNGVEIPLK